MTRFPSGAQRGRPNHHFIVVVIMFLALTYALAACGSDVVSEAGIGAGAPANVQMTGTLTRTSGPGEVVEAERTSVTTPETASAPTVISHVRPLRIRIPSIEIDTTVGLLGLTETGRLEVPTNFAETGWYDGRAAPGNDGPAIIVGHVDSQDGPAVFYNLRELEAGDLVDIDRSDGRTARFAVVTTDQTTKDEFPTAKVYDATEEPTLRLITCGGEFDYDARSYLSNLIVFAEFVQLFPTKVG